MEKVNKEIKGRWLYRSAVDGKFYTREEAQKKSDQFVKEFVPDKKRKGGKNV